MFMYTKAASEASRSKHDDRNAENKVKIISTYRPGGELTVYTCHVCYVCLYKTRGGADVRQRDAVHDQEERRRVCPAAGGTYIFFIIKIAASLFLSWSSFWVPYRYSVTKTGWMGCVFYLFCTVLVLVNFKFGSPYDSFKLRYKVTGTVRPRPGLKKKSVPDYTFPNFKLNYFTVVQLLEENFSNNLVQCCGAG